MNQKKQGGFTLIEILVVIGIIAILAAVVLVAINPAKQFRAANNTQRQSNVNAILNAIGQYAVDHKGDISLLDIAEGDPDVVGNYDVIGSASGDADICDDLVPTFLPALPVDPTGGDDSPITDCSGTYDTGYQVLKDDVGRVYVRAPETQTEDGAEIIVVTR